jgi:hypothetical protein
VLLLVAAVGCLPRRDPSPLEDALRRVTSDRDEEYEAAFAELLHSGEEAVPVLRQGMAAAPGRGFPVVAALYVAGGGDGVPLEFRVRHLARFEWPRGREERNALIIPYVRSSLERDLVRAGRPALRVLARALAEEVLSESRAMAVVRVILEIGGRGAAEAIAPLLERNRELAGGVRVSEVAAGLLLYLGSQDLLLRASSRELLVSSAREWWERARGLPESAWVAEEAQVLADHFREKDPDGSRGVLELLVGGEIENPQEWRTGNPGWTPPPPPVHPEDLLPRLAQGRPAAFAANRALEQATGLRVYLPRLDRLSDLCAAIRLWEPPPDLQGRWRRVLEGRYLRLTMDVVGHHPRRGSNHLLWHSETTAHVTESPSGKLEFAAGGEGYLLYALALGGGSRILYGEYHESEAGFRTVVRECPADHPLIRVSPDFQSVVIVSLEEVPGRRTPERPEELFSEAHRRLRRAAEAAQGTERRRALRALGYCQDPDDRDFLRKEEAFEALLLLGDPAGLRGAPTLERFEVEMALRKAEDPDLRSRLEALRAPR